MVKRVVEAALSAKAETDGPRRLDQAVYTQFVELVVVTSYHVYRNNVRAKIRGYLW